MNFEIGIAYHPRSGDLYAVRRAAGVIIEAAGPVASDDPLDDDSLYQWLSNHADTAAEDGEWLQAAIDRFLHNRS